MTDTVLYSGGAIATARWRGRAKQLGKPSSSQGEIPWSKVGSITGNTGKWAEDERVADGSVVAAKAGNSAGAKGPC